MERRIERRGLRPRDAAFLVGAFWAVAVALFGVLERIVDPKTFHTVWLGIWWGIETVTTVGYGDVVPDQTAGKVIAGFLMLGGLSLLAILTAAVTSGFVSRAQASGRTGGEDPVMRKLDELALQLEAVKADLDHLRSATAASAPPTPASTPPTPASAPPTPADPPPTAPSAPPTPTDAPHEDLSK